MNKSGDFAVEIAILQAHHNVGVISDWGSDERLSQKDVDHEGVITGRDALSLRQGLICDVDHQEVAQSERKSA